MKIRAYSSASCYSRASRSRGWSQSASKVSYMKPSLGWIDKRYILLPIVPSRITRSRGGINLSYCWLLWNGWYERTLVLILLLYTQAAWEGGSVVWLEVLFYEAFIRIDDEKHVLLTIVLPRTTQWKGWKEHWLANLMYEALIWMNDKSIIFWPWLSYTSCFRGLHGWIETLLYETLIQKDNKSACSCPLLFQPADLLPLVLL